MTLENRLRQGDVARCGHCGYVYTFTARGPHECRRCGHPTLRKWHPVTDDLADPPSTP